ncbi:MAG TPA: hypothetical protein VFB67_05300 [Candidatus Polarisedimenticolaceae bacterium]|nr:hypothetical protein [Candidatus Polarisedimenticolaceae bacterium]
MKARLALALGAIVSTAAAAYDGRASGLGVGAFIPSGDLEDTNDTSWYLQARTVFAREVFGGRAGVYYGDTTAHGAIDGGRAFGFDVEGLARFGRRETFGYVFAGAGYGRATFTRPGPLSGSFVRSSEWDWTLQGGAGIVIKRRVYLEAMYLQYQTDPKSSFIPVVIGFQY